MFVAHTGNQTPQIPCSCTVKRSLNRDVFIETADLLIPALLGAASCTALLWQSRRSSWSLSSRLRPPSSSVRTVSSSSSVPLRNRRQAQHVDLAVSILSPVRTHTFIPAPCSASIVSAASSCNLRDSEGEVFSTFGEDHIFQYITVTVLHFQKMTLVNDLT